LQPSPPNNAAGRRIGHYTVLEQIGSGGMGEVFSAVRSDGQFDQKVAIKLVRAGGDSASVLDRFRNERQILAGLDHANIARLLDGGTTEDGTPFFAMELVSGLPIDKYCDTHKLSISKRLELFREVCSAVQYAHQHLVIHRDLKPGNILVTEEGTPKLLDFGISRLLEASGSLEATQYPSFTPDYASPEQLRAEPTSTSSDIYSLGVVLYQLLTGRFPYRVEPRTPAKLSSAIAAGDPERPSTCVVQKETVTTAEGSREVAPEFFAEARETTPMLLRSNLRGDLDYILLKALRKEPDQRYSSAEQLSEDIKNHLTARPISARKGTWTYYTGKFLRRHRAGVAAAAVVFVALLTGVAISWREARIAEANRRKADARFNDVRKLANSLIFDVHDSIQTLPGATDSRKLILDKAMEYLDSLAADSQSDPSLMRDLVVGYARIAELEGNPSFPNLGDTQASLANYEKALSLEESLVRMYPQSERDRLNLAELHENLSEVHMAATGNISEALRNCRLSVEMFDAALAAKPNDVKILARNISVYRNLGLLQIGNGLGGTTGSVESGIEALERALALDSRAMELAPNDIAYRAEGAGIRIALGDAYLKLGDRSSAEQHFRESLKTFNSLEPKGENIRIMTNRAVVATKIGDAMMIEGKYAQALESYKEGQSLIENLLARDPHSETTQSHSIIVRGQVALALTHLNRFAESNPEFRKALALSANPAEQTATMRVIKGTVGIWFAQSLMHQGKNAEAAQEFARSKATFALLGDLSAMDLRSKTYRCAAQMGFGSALAAQGKFDEAQKEIEAAISILEQMQDATPPQQELLYTLAEAYNQEGLLFVRKSRGKSRTQQKLTSLQNARNWFQKTAMTWNKVKKPARLSTYGLEVSLPNEISQRIAQCDSQIATLQASTN
jgi:non-specific serine/threonine protein kinase/serine/threonine-protein kinase